MPIIIQLPVDIWMKYKKCQHIDWTIFRDKVGIMAFLDKTILILSGTIND